MRSGSRYFTVLTCLNKLTVPRLGVIVAKKHVRGAVRRNLIRRLIKESFRLHQHTMIGLDLVVLVRSGLSDKTGNQDISKCLKRHWQDLVSIKQQLKTP